jgi:hypothetical protein
MVTVVSVNLYKPKTNAMFISNLKLYLHLPVIALLLSATAQGQSNASEVNAEKSYFKAGLSYLSNSVYYGRKDSLRYPYFTPTLGYYHKSGFYANASLSYLASKESRIDLYTLEAGYEFELTHKLTGSLYADKYFYNQSSTNIQSDIKGNGGFTLSYNFGALQFNTGADVMFANKTDFSLNAGLSRDFTIGEEAKQWTITPTVTTYLSTLNFYEGYTSRRAGKNAQQPNGATISSNTFITNRSTGLTLLDFELSVPVSYDAAKWGLSFTPTLALPTNPIFTSTTTTITPRIGNPFSQTRNTTPTSEKNLTSVFYAELMVYFKF